MTVEFIIQNKYFLVLPADKNTECRQKYVAAEKYLSKHHAEGQGRQLPGLWS